MHTTFQLVDCRPHLNEGQQPIFLLARDFRGAGSAARWLVPSGSLPLADEGTLDWSEPLEYLMTQRGDVVRVPLYRYLVGSDSRAALAAACLQVGAEVTHRLPSGAQIEQLMIVMGDMVYETEDARQEVYVGLALQVS